MQKLSKKGYTKYANAIIFILLFLFALAMFAFIWYITARIGTN